MMITQKQKRLMAIGGVLLVLALLIIAVTIALRLQQIGTEPVAPSVPKSQPKAQGAIPTPGPDSACRKTWIIASAPTLTPTLTSTPTPTGTLTPTPTSTPTPMATNTPQPTNTPAPLAQGPTVIPTVAQQALPQAGSIGQTIGVIVAGLGALILGILLIL